MAWVLGSERHYTNGKTAKLYHLKTTFLFHECADKPTEAKQYRTKKEALEDRKMSGLGKNWIPERVE